MVFKRRFAPYFEKERVELWDSSVKTTPVVNVKGKRLIPFERVMSHSI